MSFVPELPTQAVTGQVKFATNEVRIVRIPTGFTTTIEAGGKHCYETSIQTLMKPGDKVMLMDNDGKSGSTTSFGDMDDQTRVALERGMVQSITTSERHSDAPYAIQAQVGNTRNSAMSDLKHGTSYSFLFPPKCSNTATQTHFDTRCEKGQEELFAKYGNLTHDSLLGKINPDKAKADACNDTSVMPHFDKSIVSVHVTHPIAAVMARKCCAVENDAVQVLDREAYDSLTLAYDTRHNVFNIPKVQFLQEVDDLEKHVLSKFRTDSLHDQKLTLQRSEVEEAHTVTTDTTGAKIFGPTTKAHPCFGDLVELSNPMGLPKSQLIKPDTTFTVGCNLEVKMAILAHEEKAVNKSDLATFDGVVKTYHALYPLTQM